MQKKKITFFCFVCLQSAVLQAHKSCAVLSVPLPSFTRLLLHPSEQE